ncbi:hypothetical protein [Homoserinibacter sp. YIM 151385]|uniref:hypothetical protein n=1 Tax=Homoserinibacter sp. YIM 151385 TaxID=2985506 RepID=UPI0022F07A10|nr:hypothetical protein [Homoserinibacter sp. YIM 151385]WBU38052.1 hypothetical protein OF852_00265 [Homoserinibacter sp. YIM 151385]
MGRLGPGSGAALLALLLALGGALLPVAPASAAALAVTSHRDDQFVAGPAVPLAGTGAEGARIEIRGSGVETCSTTVRGGTWACRLQLPNGRTVLTVSQLETVSQPGDASAAPEPTPAPAPVELRIALRVLGAPAFDRPGEILTSGIVTGTAVPHAGVRVTLRPERGGAAVTESCPPAEADGAWTCPLSVPAGAYRATVVQYAPDDPSEASPPSAEVRIVVDREPPAAPVITSPAEGAELAVAGAAFAGTGERAATLDVFASGQRLCTAEVRADLSWRCEALTIAAGRYVVQAIQRDAAGNISNPSRVLRLVFRADSSPKPSPEETPDGDDDGDSQDPGSGEGSPGRGSGDGGDGGDSGDGADTAAPGSGAPHGWTSRWSEPSGFGSALPAVATALRDPASIAGLLLAALFVGLVALPLRLLAGALRGREPMRLPALFGRNQPRAVTGLGSPADGVAGAHAVVAASGGVATGGSGGSGGAGVSGSTRRGLLLAALAAAGVTTMLAAGLHGDARDVRLLTAVGAALVMLNGLGILLPAVLAGRALGEPVRMRLVPGFLLAAAAAAVLSRLVGISPPVLIGVVAGAALVAGTPRSRAIVQLAQIAGTTILALAAWLAHDAAASVGGSVGLLLGETFAAVCIAGFGSAVLLALPVAGLPGRALFAWSPLAWSLVAVPVVALAGVVLTTAVGFPVLLLVVAAAVTAAVSIGTWAWVHFVEPALVARTPDRVD